MIVGKVLIALYLIDRQYNKILLIKIENVKQLKTPKVLDNSISAKSINIGTFEC